MARIRFTHTYDSIISLENLLGAWREFIVGKHQRKDVQEFERNLMSNIISLHNDLVARTYRHRGYEAFNISDPKPRNIHKASVRDRLLHRAIYRQLYPFFDRTFIPDSYSCRYDKATHKAIRKLKRFVWQLSNNRKETVWVLKCDIRKFFASIDHGILLSILEKYIEDQNIIHLFRLILQSFSVREGIGLPLGNLTSQLLVNIYLNEFDQFVKHRLKARYYIRYADDFVILEKDKARLGEILSEIKTFLSERLKLELHPDKVSVRTIFSGVDFLGWVHFPNHRVLRTTTKRRMIRNLKAKQGNGAVKQSYLGLLSHGNTKKLQNKIMDDL